MIFFRIFSTKLIMPLVLWMIRRWIPRLIFWWIRRRILRPR
jgi:hypothetical protein